MNTAAVLPTATERFSNGPGNGNTTNKVREMLKKDILFGASALAGVLILPLTATADYFVGGGIGAGAANIETVAQGTGNNTQVAYSENDQITAPALMLSAGANRDSGRLYALIQVLPYEDAIVGFYGVSHDWTFGNHRSLKPFAGLSAGLATLSWTEDLQGDGFTAELEGETATSFALGLQAGLLFDVDRTLSLEAGVRLLATDLTTTLSGDSLIGGNPGQVEQTTESLVTVIIGANYNF